MGLISTFFVLSVLRSAMRKDGWRGFDCFFWYFYVPYLYPRDRFLECAGIFIYLGWMGLIGMAFWEWEWEGYGMLVGYGMDGCHR